jgi:hypothetical protein
MFSAPWIGSIEERLINRAVLILNDFVSSRKVLDAWRYSHASLRCGAMGGGINDCSVLKNAAIPAGQAVLAIAGEAHGAVTGARHLRNLDNRRDEDIDGDKKDWQPEKYKKYY